MLVLEVSSQGQWREGQVVLFVVNAISRFTSCILLGLADVTAGLISYVSSLEPRGATGLSPINEVLGVNGRSLIVVPSHLSSSKSDDARDAGRIPTTCRVLLSSHRICC